MQMTDSLLRVLRAFIREGLHALWLWWWASRPLAA